MLFNYFHIQVALKRQQAVEDAIALRLASNETGTSLDVLPPGKIFGMNVTEPCATPPTSPTTTLEQPKPCKQILCYKLNKPYILNMIYLSF